MSKHRTEIPDLKDILPMSDEDLASLERQNREYMSELQIKRSLLDKCRQELNDATLKSQELERQLIIEKCKNENDAKQYILLLNATQTLEQDRRVMSAEFNKLKAQVEITTADRNCLKVQTGELYVENIKMKRQLEDLENKHRCQEYYQKDLLEHQARLKLLINQLNNSMNTLRIKQEQLKTLEDTVQARSQVAVIKQAQEERDVSVKRQSDLERQLIIKTAELSKLQVLLFGSPFAKKYKAEPRHFESWDMTIEDLEKRLAVEVNGATKVISALELANASQLKLEEAGKKLVVKIEELEKQIYEMKTKNLNLQIIMDDIESRQDARSKIRQCIVEIEEIIRTE